MPTLRIDQCESALRCDCGYDFQSGEVKGSYLNIPERAEVIFRDA